MGDEKEEIRLLEKEIKDLERLIKNHGRKEETILATDYTGRLTAQGPARGTALGNRYQWTKQGLEIGCSSITSENMRAGKSSNLERNYGVKSLSQGVDMRQPACMHKNGQKSGYKIGRGQLTGAVTQDVILAHCSTEAVSSASRFPVQPRYVSSAQKLQSVQNEQPTVKAVSSGIIDAKAASSNVIQFQRPASSAATAAAKTSGIERPKTRLVSMNGVSRESVIANRVAGKTVKNVAAVADELQKHVEQCSVASSVVNQNCVVNKAETVDSVGIRIKSSSDMNRLCTINKYKLIRPVDTKNLQPVAASLPFDSQFICKQALSPRKKSPRSAFLTSFHQKGHDVIHKSKYKLVKSLPDSFSSISNNVSNPDFQMMPFQLSQVNGTNGKQKKCLSSSVVRHTSSPTISLGSTVADISEISPANRVHILSRYKLVKTSHMKHLQPSREKRKKRPRTRSFVQSTKKNSWISKYALKREFGDVSQMSNCINAILGRRVSNLSANKYKFINARPDSSQLLANSVQKRRMLKIDRRKGAKSPLQMRRLSWSNVPKSASSTHLNFNQSKRKSSLFARSMSRLETQRSLTGKRSCLQNPSAGYCIFYSRFGHCNNGERCKYIHDPDKISVCTRFLRGTCKVTDCPFSHKVAKHKMPMCRFFLRRACNRDDCPYSHVNVAKDAEICLEFLKGFCAEGDLCKKKHMLVCSDFSESGSCPRGKSCPMQHPKNPKAQWKTKSNGSPRKKLKLNCKNTEQSNKDEETTDDQSRPLLCTDLDDVNLPWKERRLPAYIALNNSSINDESLEKNLSNPVSVPGCSAKLNIHPRIKMPSESAYEQIEAIIQQSSQES